MGLLNRKNKKDDSKDKKKRLLDKSHKIDDPNKNNEKGFFKKKNKKTVKNENKKTNINEKENSDIFDYYEENIEEVKEKIDYKDKKNENKPLLKRDMKDKPVYLEDTGEKIGIVFETIFDSEKKISGYKIKDGKSETILSFPQEQFIEDKNGLIFTPGWFNKSLKIVEKLEFKDRISPELTALLTDDTVSNNEIYNIFVKHDDEMADFIDEAISLREIIKNKLDIFERKRYSLKDDLMDLTEKRLINDIDRRDFSEQVLRHRRKVNILDVNINKCKEILKRLDNTSFGILGKKTMVEEKKIEKTIENNEKSIIESINKYNQSEKINIPYKEKYFELKNQYEQLDSEYRELKYAVEKLIQKENL